MSWAVKFEGVSKRYRGGGPRYGSLRHDLSAGFKRIGRLFSRAAAEPQGKLALDDVSFEVQQGESFAIIGPNGAGKTTALRLLSRISYPTGGRVRVRGRVGALIEVGSGVHPELTGRENIWLYGQIVGISKTDIQRRFEKIVEFAELQQVLDVPVKMYSSGMQLRLGFAVASHLEPDVFVVDEALAVGDAAFQVKCVERMTQLVKNGHSLLFVSHNLSAVEAVCERGMFLLGGRAQARAPAPIQEILRSYMVWVDEELRIRKHASGRLAGAGITVEHVTLHASDGTERQAFESGEGIEVRAHVVAHERISNAWFSVGISDGRPGALALCTMLERGAGVHLALGGHVVACHLEGLPFSPGTYEVWLSVRERSGVANLVERAMVGAFRIQPLRQSEGPSGMTASWLYGPVRIPHHWSVEREVPPGPHSEARRDLLT